MQPNPRLRTVLVEDDPSIRSEMSAILSENPIAYLVAQTGHVEETIQLIPQLTPDLVLLDIHLADGTCFDILEKLQPIRFRTVFITGYEEYAIRAIKYGALDYILKPPDPDELDLALLKAQQAMPMATQQFKTVAAAMRHTEAPIVAVNDGPIWHIIHLNEVIFAQSGEDTIIYLSDGSYVSTSKTISELYDVWPASLFVRPHASYLVNIQKLKSFNNRTHELILKNGISIPVAAKRKEAIMTLLLNK